MVTTTVQVCRGGNCGHPAEDHENGAGRCSGESHDEIYGSHRCLCPYFAARST